MRKLYNRRAVLLPTAENVIDPNVCQQKIRKNMEFIPNRANVGSAHALMKVSITTQDINKNTLKLPIGIFAALQFNFKGYTISNYLTLN